MIFRQKRHQERHLESQRAKLGLSTDVKLLPEAEEDTMASLGVQFGDPHIYTKKLREKRRAISAESIFALNTASKARKAAAASKGPLRGEAGQKNQMKTF